MNEPKTKTWITILGLLALLTSGCADASLSDAEAGADRANNGGMAPIADAQASLRAHDVEGARDFYRGLLEDSGGTNGRAAAGLAVTDVLLLPYWDETRVVLMNGFGATDGLDHKRDVIYGEHGFLYLLARGVPWEDSENLVGIKSLLEGDLPWRSSKLESIETFVDGLSDPVDLLADDLVALADAMERIEANIDVALNDETFTTLYVPGETFHVEELSLTLGKSELALLKSGVSFTRGAIYFFAAYEHSWSLERAVGDVWSEVVSDPQHPDHVEGWQVEDYQADYVDDRLLRQFDDRSRLGTARDAFTVSFDAAILSIDEGLEETEFTTMAWSAASSEFAADLRALLVATRGSLEGAAELPFTEPATTMNLSPFFTDGRTLPEEHAWLEKQVVDDGGRTTEEYVVRDEALEVLFDGVFQPPYDAQNPPEVTLEDRSDNFSDDLIGDIATSFEDAYLTQ